MTLLRGLLRRWGLVLLLSGCKPDAVARPGAAAAQPGAAAAQPGAAAARPGGHEVLPAGAAPAGESVYQLHLDLEDQQGRRSGFDVMRGHPVLVALFYSSCPNACPMLVRRVRQVEEKLSPGARADLRVLLISMDPAKDTPAELRGAAARHEVDGARWRLTRTSEEEVRMVAAVLGVKYRRLADGSYNHSSVLTLLDREGAVAGRVTSLNDPLDQLIATAEALVRARRPD